MEEEPKEPADTLRKRAEALSREGTFSPQAYMAEEAAKLIQELQIHQIELEIQNEDLRHTQDELSLSRDRFALLFHQAPVGYLVLSENGTIHESNDTFCRMVNCDIDKVAGKGLYEFIAVQDRDRFLARYRAFFKQPEGKSLEVSLLSHSLPPLFVQMTGSVLTLPFASTQSDTYSPRLLMIVSDITERKRADAALNRSEKRYTTTLMSIGDGIIASDPSGRVELMNPVAEGLTGWKQDEAGGKHLEEIFRIVNEKTREPADQLVVQTILDGVEEGLVDPTILVARNGDEFPVAITAAPIRDGEGVVNGVVLVFRDQTRERLAAEALTAKQRQLEELNQSLEQRILETVSELRQKDQVLINQSRMAAMGEMIDNIAHQWRQPLNALALVLANIKDAFLFNDLNAEFMDKAIADGHRLVQKMSSTINDFRNFFRPNKEATVFSAREQINETLTLLKSSFKNKNVTIHFDESQDLKLTGFPNEYSQVMLNLLFNAVEAIHACGQTEGKVNIRMEKRGEQAFISISDNGGGIPPNILNKIFDPYFSTKKWEQASACICQK